jgi:hypothetical protein
MALAGNGAGAPAAQPAVQTGAHGSAIAGGAAAGREPAAVLRSAQQLAEWRQAHVGALAGLSAEDAARLEALGFEVRPREGQRARKAACCRALGRAGQPCGARGGLYVCCGAHGGAAPPMTLLLLPLRPLVLLHPQLNRVGVRTLAAALLATANWATSPRVRRGGGLGWRGAYQGSEPAATEHERPQGLGCRGPAAACVGSQGTGSIWQPHVSDARAPAAAARALASSAHAAGHPGGLQRPGRAAHAVLRGAAGAFCAQPQAGLAAAAGPGGGCARGPARGAVGVGLRSAGGGGAAGQRAAASARAGVPGRPGTGEWLAGEGTLRAAEAVPAMRCAASQPPVSRCPGCLMPPGGCHLGPVCTSTGLRCWLPGQAQRVPAGGADGAAAAVQVRAGAHQGVVALHARCKGLPCRRHAGTGLLLWPQCSPSGSPPALGPAPETPGGGEGSVRLTVCVARAFVGPTAWLGSCWCPTAASRSGTRRRAPERRRSGEGGRDRGGAARVQRLRRLAYSL